MREEKSKQELASLPKNDHHHPEKYQNEHEDIRSHERKSSCVENHERKDEETKSTQTSFSGTASHVAEKVKDALVEGAITVKEVVTGVGSKITEKASNYVHHANATLKKNAALRRARRAHQHQEEAEALEKEAITMYDEAVKSEIHDLKNRLEVIVKAVKDLENRIRDETFLLNETDKGGHEEQPEKTESYKSKVGQKYKR